MESGGHQSSEDQLEQHKREVQEEYHARPVETSDAAEEQELIQLLKNQKHEVYSNKVDANR